MLQFFLSVVFLKMAGYLSFSYIYDTILLNYHSAQVTRNNFLKNRI